MTVADGMLALTQLHEENAVVRKIRVVKMRGQAHLGGSHTMRITDDGVRVYPRVLPHLARDLAAGAPIARDPRRVPTGVPGLDELMYGGLPQGHSMLVSGPTGCGKTILGTRFLQEGARQGEHGVAVFFEKGTARLRNAELAELVQQGKVTVVESRAIDQAADELLDDICTVVDRSGATRVVIDSLSELGLYLAPEARSHLRETVFRILAALAQRGVSVILTTGMDDRYDQMTFSRTDISYLTDAIVAMRFAEIEGQLRKFISVVKVRGSGHSSDLREYRITDAGLDIDPARTDYDGILHGLASLRASKD
jgi:circadian clock protein KaiC